MNIEFDFIGRNVEYCTDFINKNKISAKFVSYVSLNDSNINAEKIIVRQRYIEDDILELIYCMFS